MDRTVVDGPVGRRVRRLAAVAAITAGTAVTAAACGGGGAGATTSIPASAMAAANANVGTGVCAYVSQAEAQAILGEPVAVPSPGNPNTAACDYSATEGSADVQVTVDGATGATGSFTQLAAGGQAVSAVGSAASCSAGPPATLYAVSGHYLVTVTAPDCDTATAFAQKALTRVH